MRFAVRVLAFLGAGAISLALADPSTPAPDTTPAPAAATAPAATAPTPGARASLAPTATPSSAATAPVKPAVDPEEKRLIAMGYRPVMRHGEKVFCKLVEETGSRLGSKKECGTPKELAQQRTSIREQVEEQQRLQLNPSENSTGQRMPGR
jgi:hypothetical protein